MHWPFVDEKERIKKRTYIFIEVFTAIEDVNRFRMLVESIFRSEKGALISMQELCPLISF